MAARLTNQSALTPFVATSNFNSQFERSTRAADRHDLSFAGLGVV